MLSLLLGRLPDGRNMVLAWTLPHLLHQLKSKKRSTLEPTFPLDKMKKLKVKRIKADMLFTPTVASSG